METVYWSVQWRKRLERKGWRRFTSAPLPNCIIEFHIIHQGRLYTGRWHGTRQSTVDAVTPGTAAYVLIRRDLMQEGVWRRANNQAAAVGVISRPWP